MAVSLDNTEIIHTYLDHPFGPECESKRFAVSGSMYIDLLPSRGVGISQSRS